MASSQISSFSLNNVATTVDSYALTYLPIFYNNGINYILPLDYIVAIYGSNFVASNGGGVIRSVSQPDNASLTPITKNFIYQAGVSLENANNNFTSVSSNPYSISNFSNMFINIYDFSHNWYETDDGFSPSLNLNYFTTFNSVMNNLGFNNSYNSSLKLNNSKQISNFLPQTQYPITPNDTYQGNLVNVNYLLYDNINKSFVASKTNPKNISAITLGSLGIIYPASFNLSVSSGSPPGQTQLNQSVSDSGLLASDFFGVINRSNYNNTFSDVMTNLYRFMLYRSGQQPSNNGFTNYFYDDNIINFLISYMPYQFAAIFLPGTFSYNLTRGYVSGSTNYIQGPYNDALAGSFNGFISMKPSKNINIQIVNVIFNKNNIPSGFSQTSQNYFTGGLHNVTLSELASAASDTLFCDFISFLLYYTSQLGSGNAQQLPKILSFTVPGNIFQESGGNLRSNLAFGTPTVNNVGGSSSPPEIAYITYNIDLSATGVNNWLYESRFRPYLIDLVSSMVNQ